MNKKSSFAIHKALIGIGGEPKSVKRLRSGDLLIETSSSLQTKSLLLATYFLDSPLTRNHHKSLNTSHGVLSEPDFLSTPEAEILDGFSDQGVIQVRRITVKKDNTNIPTKHLIITFNNPKLPSTIKAGYLNFSTSPYTTQAIVLPSATSIKPTTQIESQLPGPISASAAAPDNSLNTSTSSLSTETCPAPTTSNMFAALQPSEHLLECATTASNSENF
ncbi:putative RNA-directed DNA polymerase from transposon BS [Trichonephila clavipes]|nr:putative RNA-directed DNA polymerase from transposon BS [Trichonephila clavipes]